MAGIKAFVCLLMIEVVVSQDSQILGILKQSDVSNTGSLLSSIFDLLPELIAASSQIRSNDIVDTVEAYMPFARRIMAGQSPNGQLTVEQSRQISFAEKVVPPMMRFAEGLSGGSSADQPFALNDTPNDDFTSVMLKMLPDIADIINQLKAKYGGWPGTDKSLEIVKAFMPLVRKATRYQEQHDGRYISQEEKEYLAFTEKVVPTILDYSQALYNGNINPGQEDHIGQLVMSAVEDLHRNTNQRSSNFFSLRQGAQIPRVHFHNTVF